jgi:predicted RNase H-like nuclease
LYLPDQLDALVAAYTAWLAVERQEKITNIGDFQEGQIVLPVTELKDKY